MVSNVQSYGIFMTLKITCQERCCRRDNKRLRKKVRERKLAYNSMGQGAT